MARVDCVFVSSGEAGKERSVPQMKGEGKGGNIGQLETNYMQ